MLEVVQFKSPDTLLKSSQAVSSAKYGFLVRTILCLNPFFLIFLGVGFSFSGILQAEDILTNPATCEKGGVYYYSERGDRLIDLAAFRDKLWQVQYFLSPHHTFPLFCHLYFCKIPLAK